MSQEIKTINEEKIEHNAPPEIVWVKVRDAVRLIWADNIKHHDIGALMASIKMHGLQEIPKFDKTLSGIKAGNGRVEALARMEKEEYELPRGVAVENGTNHWVMPLIIGTDADSYAEAAAYAVDSNNTVMMGGGFSLGDISRLYDPDQYKRLVEQIDGAGAKMVSLDAEDIQTLYKMMSMQEDDLGATPVTANMSEMIKANDIPEEEDGWPSIKGKVRPDLYEVYLQVTSEFGDSDSERLEGLLTRYKLNVR